ncbi:MAG: argininosuccinate lyase, partial [Muribaculaceae bacterium]|nr:argininosuccinate lyase [Muribaculaceae bacterium]
FEIMRGKCNRLQAVPNELTLLMANLPMGYHRDNQLLKDVIFPAFDELADCIELCDLMLRHITVKSDIINDARYDYLFTVEEVNRLVLSGVPFREAYRRVGAEVQQGTFKADRTVKHTHTGSIGNPANEEIKAKMNKMLAKFGICK